MRVRGRPSSILLVCFGLGADDKDHHCPWQHVAIFVVVRRLMLLLCYFVLYDILVCCTLQHCIFKFQLLALSEVTISNLTKLLLYKLEPMVTSLVPTTN